MPGIPDMGENESLEHLALKTRGAPLSKFLHSVGLNTCNLKKEAGLALGEQEGNRKSNPCP